LGQSPESYAVRDSLMSQEYVRRPRNFIFERRIHMVSATGI
jgi:hypothetical protein